ncbi:MAG TPA: 3-hydroxyacyl-CoA dehydrogenase NAD-binding domain-containing protein [Caulobacteraceae bacterium]|nr:3-hydroxyacyl-CoA dehydrogenase NAD-binding domain-containing protein [Caulobacteraceae bacterium]
MAAVNEVVDLSKDGDVAVITVNSPPVNALGAKVRDGLKGAFDQAFADPSAKAIVLICEGKTFIAGADISEFGKPPSGAPLGEVLDNIENSPKPVIAAIHGTALGGGLETALVCHYRVAVPSAKVGLPEVNIGLLPGAGGTQRLPRIVGVQKALEMVTSGDHVPAKAAAEMGLVDQIVDEGNLRAGAIAFAQDVLAQGKPLKKVRDLPVNGDPQVFADFRKANARKFRGMMAPENNIKAVEAAAALPFDEGMKEERRLFMELMTGSQSRALRYAFFAQREAAKIPDIDPNTPLRPIRKVGVIGAGTMGGGISMNFANAGIPVTIVEMKQEALDRGLGVVRKNYENTGKRRGWSAEDVDKRMNLLTGSLELSALADCDLIIEAVFELMEIKKDIFGKLDGICKPGAILASNTSYLNIDEIAAVTKRPADVIGLHFFSPANVMKLLEIVRGRETGDDVVMTSMALAKTIAKVPVLVGVGPGFVGNRMLAQRTRESQALVMEGAMPWQVDKVLYDFGMPMGPFAMGDLAGLDIGWDPAKTSSSTIREVLCEQGRRGQKTGAGYYDYDENRNAKPSPVTEQIIKDFQAKAGITPRAVSDQEILERCIYPMINEGAKILDEGKAMRASDIDVVWLNGYGWPAYRGGPMHYANEIGLATVLEKMKEFEVKLGPQFKPSALLEKLVAEGKTFADVPAQALKV